MLGGLFIQMVVLVLLMVKPLLDGVSFPDSLVGASLSCLALSSPQRLVSLFPGA